MGDREANCRRHHPGGPSGATVTGVVAGLVFGVVGVGMERGGVEERHAQYGKDGDEKGLQSEWDCMAAFRGRRGRLDSE